MVESLGWGIMGTGFVAKLFAADLVASGFRVTAVGSRSAGTADAFGDEYGIPARHANYDDLVHDPSVDVVYVSTPHPLHAEHAILALRAGKHVLLEKPFTLNAAEAQSVVDVATEFGLVVLEAMWTRWLPHMIRIRELLDSGAIGQVRALIADHDQKLSSDPTHRLNAPELGGGALLDLGIYPASFAWDVFGKPDGIQSTSSPTSTSVDAHTGVMLSYREGGIALLHSSLDAQGPNRATIIGTAGRIEIDPVWYIPTSFTLLDAEGSVVERYTSEVAHRGMQYQAYELE